MTKHFLLLSALLIVVILTADINLASGNDCLMIDGNRNSVSSVEMRY